MNGIYFLRQIIEVSGRKSSSSRQIDVAKAFQRQPFPIIDKRLCD
jgi:hypothetical protein